MKYIDTDRIVFGSDNHVHDVAWELGRLLSEDISDEDLQKILAANTRRIMGQ